jgi:co-chaperonin GroES (HSP10)
VSLDPRNRYLLLTVVEEQPEEENKSRILLPDDYTQKKSPYGVYLIEQIAEDCSKVTLGDIGKKVLVNDTMIETASLDQGDFLLVQENHIYGVLEG